MNSVTGGSSAYNMKLIRFGIAGEALGVAVLAVTLFSCTPPVMLICLPLALLFMGLGWLCWAWEFLRNL